MNYGEIIEFLNAHAEDKYAAFTGKLTPTTDKIYGVRVPVLRKYAKEIAKTDAAEFLAQPKNSLEEKMLHGFVIGYAKCGYGEFVTRVKDFAPMIDNWAVCDTASSTFKQIEKHREEFLPVITELFGGGEFHRRLAFTLLLDFYVSDGYLDYIFGATDNITEADGYYVKMAAAWLLSVCYIKLKDRTEKYLAGGTLEKFTLNKAIQKITESYRVEEADKQRLKKLKVK